MVDGVGADKVDGVSAPSISKIRWEDLSWAEISREIEGLGFFNGWRPDVRVGKVAPARVVGSVRAAASAAGSVRVARAGASDGVAGLVRPAAKDRAVARADVWRPSCRDDREPVSRVASGDVCAIGSVVVAGASGDDARPVLTSSSREPISAKS